MLPRNLTLLKFSRVEIRRPYFDPHPSKSTTQNHAWRLGMFVHLQDLNGREYIWMPRWSNLDNMNKGRLIVEDLNRRRCAEARKEAAK